MTVQSTTRFSLFAATVAAAFAGSAMGAIKSYTASLSWLGEAAPVSPGTGSATFDIDTVLNTLKMHIEFSGLNGNTTASHIHGATAIPLTGNAGVATTTPSLVGFPLGVKSGIVDITLDMTLASSFNAAYITANGGTVASARTALFSAIDSGRTYLNIHSTTNGGGEIRGFIVPAPGVAGLVGACGLLAARRRR
jgi:hypothetical protein